MGKQSLSNCLNMRSSGFWIFIVHIIFKQQNYWTKLRSSFWLNQPLSTYMRHEDLLAQACLALFIGLACSAAHAAAIIGWRAAAGSIQLIDVLMAQCTAPHFLRLAGAEWRLLTPGQVSVWSSSSSAAVSPCSSSQPFSCSPPPCTTLLPWRSKLIYLVRRFRTM